MKAFIARGSAPRHARFMGAIGVGKAVTERGSRRVEPPIDPPSASLFFAAAAGAFEGGAGAGAGRAGAGAGAGAATGLAGAGVLGGAGLGSLEPLLPIEVGGEGRSKRRNLFCLVERGGAKSEENSQPTASRVFKHVSVASWVRHFEARDPARGERAPSPWRLANVPC